MEFHMDQFNRPNVHYPWPIKRGSLMTICFLFIFVMSLFSPQLQMPAYAVATPDLVAPADGVTITATGIGLNAIPPVALPEFSWTAVTDTTKYRLQISRDIAFSNSYDYTTPLTRFTPLSVDPFNDGLWYWRVRVDEPVAGYFSQPRSFTKQWASSNNMPVLLSPAAGATLEFYDAPTFSWQPVIGAAAYRFQIASSSDFSTMIYNATVLATTHQPASKFSNGTRYWRVIPIDPSGRDGTPSQVRTVIISYNQVPELIEPANNSYPTFTPTFRWKAVRGAQYYLLQYSTDPTFNANLTQIQTRNTTYTPNDPLPNDVNYYWRVRTYSRNSESDWSPSWIFLKQWYIRPVLLTPTNNFQHVRFPVFSWTPVPGASFYRIELSPTTDFVNPYVTGETSNPFYTPTHYEGKWNIVYWRVIPFDAVGNRGKESLVSSYYSDPYQNTPDLISPFYYYLPNSFPPPFNTVSMNPYTDRSVSWPLFIWNRITAPVPDGGTLPAAYRIQVSTSSLFTSILWTVDTQNTYAAPTIANNFIPTPGVDYFWRVRGLNSVGAEIGNWSQVWKARFTLTSSGNQPSSPPPQLLRPFAGAEIVETTPLLEWIPVLGADSYEVQICDDASCSTKLNPTEYASYPAYIMKTSLAQRSLGKINYGSFYWRVQARYGGSPLGGWSETRRFQIASQSERVESRILGNASNRLLIATDPLDTTDKNYELTTLYATQDSNFWYFGFNATVTTANLSYGLYLDLDHKDNSGATFDPRGYAISAVPAHLPEFAIYVNQVSGVVTATQTEVYAWNGVDWNPPSYLSELGGNLYYDAGTGYIEIKVPNTSIGMREDTGSYALSLFSVPPLSGQAVDSVPSDPNVPGSGPISRFASVSERMNTFIPPFTPEGDLTTYPFIFPFYWNYPTGSNGTAPWAGARMKVYRDPGFTTEVANFEVQSDTSYYAPASFHAPNDFIGDNTYYWRIQPSYLLNGTRIYGVWSQGGRFVREGFLPENLNESVTFATPTFSWDMVEGATRYELQVDDDSNFASPVIYVSTAQSSFTPNDTLPSGTYYWRVRVIRYSNATSDWSPSKTFTLTLPLPTGLAPNNADPNYGIHSSPTFCWQPLIVSSGGVPVLAAWRYILQVSRGDPTFSSIYEQVDTEQSCWTPTGGYDDGTYYWRVAMVDGGNRQGDFSPFAVFTKQYPIAKPLSPATGSTVGATPTFTWTAADGVTPYVFGAARYRLEISQFPTFSPLYEQVDTHSTRYTPSRLYDENKTYYWRVAIIDRDSKIGPFTNAILIMNPFPIHIYLPSVLHD